MKYYRINEGDLYEILVAAYNFWELEGGGVDNWEWAGASVQDFLDDMNKENYTSFESIEEMVEHDMKIHYPICTCRNDKPSSFDELVRATL